MLNHEHKKYLVNFQDRRSGYLKERVVFCSRFRLLSLMYASTAEFICANPYMFWKVESDQDETAE